MTIPQLLQRWHIIQPDICRKGRFGRYIIDAYEFAFNSDGSLYAYVAGKSGRPIADQPALDWLDGCVRRAIEAQDLYLATESVNTGRWSFRAKIIGQPDIYAVDSEISLLDAVLQAWVEYLEAQ